MSTQPELDMAADRLQRMGIAERPRPPMSPSSFSSGRHPSSSSVPLETSPGTSPRSPEIFIAIGIDFGTTFSGVSWAYSTEPKLIHEVIQWPRASGEKEDDVQVPSRYSPSTGDWGYLATRNAKKWFKLLLVAPEDTKTDVNDSEYLKDARGWKLNVVQLIADYLRKLWEHALTEISKNIGASIDQLPLKVAITIPAIWPQYAREKMKHAAHDAGICRWRNAGRTQLDLVEEPEAAALGTLFDLANRKDSPKIDVGALFIVCDCGGGTVDVISYKVTSMKPFRIEEAAKGDGKLCGAFLIDDEFVKWMRHKSGPKFQKAPSDEIWGFVNEDWEHNLKRIFSGTEATDEFFLKPPPSVLSRIQRLRGGEYALKKETIRQFFARTYNGTRYLINQQKKSIARNHDGKKPSNILLVGGLGSSKYLFDRLQEEHENVFQPFHPWSVVARGAVISVLQESNSGVDERLSKTLLRMPEVSGRRSRLHYGVEGGVPTSEASPPVDDAYDRVTSDPAGYDVVWRMTWFLKKAQSIKNPKNDFPGGEMVDNKDPVTADFYQYIHGPDMTKATFRILVSDALYAPIRLDSTVHTLCTLDCDFDTPFDKMNSVSGVRRVDDIKLTMRFQGEPKWAFQTGKNIVEQGVNVQYSEF
ncbi:hypothetical protein F4780DRAFT_781247 [Xylariomycetidae sp. FL0641]|nr:hypothetical protein F4780DRAFT_781247 [Xylariomycetidae sp. FL0641]